MAKQKALAVGMAAKRQSDIAVAAWPFKGAVSLKPWA
jgi:hypothetical protein